MEKVAQTMFMFKKTYDDSENYTESHFVYTLKTETVNVFIQNILRFQHAYCVISFRLFTHLHCKGTLLNISCI